MVRNTLHDLESKIQYSDAAYHLLLMTAAHESAGLKYDRQIKGPALSYFQIEPATHVDVFVSYLKYRRELCELVLDGIPLSSMRWVGRQLVPLDEYLVENPWYACKIARLVYFRVPQPLPKYDDENVLQSLVGLSYYAKKHYNTVEGKATAGKYLADYKMYFM